jgi:hypothetical protein
LAWVESASASFTARHESEDAGDAQRMLDQLEGLRKRLADTFPRAPGELVVVIHDSAVPLYLAAPYLPLARALTAPAGRRYQVGWFGAREVHVLAPRVLEGRASQAAGSREALMLTPAALYASVVVGVNNPELPPPFRLGSFVRYMRWAWLAQGAAQFFSGQVPHLRAAIARRLRENGAPDFPPSARDAALLGGTVFDLLAREEGEAACVQLASRLHPGGAGPALQRAFHGRAVKHTEGTWRAHLARLAGASSS